MLIKQFFFSERSHVTPFIFQVVALDNGKNSGDCGHGSVQGDWIETLLFGLVLVLKDGALNVVGGMQTLDSVSQEFNGLDGLEGGRASGIQDHGFVLSFEKEFTGVGGVNEGSGPGLESDDVFIGLLSVLVAHSSVFVDRESLAHRCL